VESASRWRSYVAAGSRDLLRKSGPPERRPLRKQRRLPPCGTPVECGGLPPLVRGEACLAARRGDMYRRGVKTATTEEAILTRMARCCRLPCKNPTKAAFLRRFSSRWHQHCCAQRSGFFARVLAASRSGKCLEEKSARPWSAGGRSRFSRRGLPRRPPRRHLSPGRKDGEALRRTQGRQASPTKGGEPPHSTDIEVVALAK
jgi:hypothetical protein